MTQYPLVVNHLNPNASWCVGDGPGCLFETYGEELTFVRQQDPRTIWTLVDGDDGDQYLINGFHFVNRIGYLVSTVPVPEETDIEVRIPMQENPTTDPDKPAANMIDLDQRLSEMAREHLGIPTLGIRNSDSLDFYDVPVCEELAVYAEVKQLFGRRVTEEAHGYRERLIQNGEAPFRCRAGARYLYIDEFGMVRWCAQTRMAFGKSLSAYALEDLRQHFYSEKACSDKCCVGCVRTASALDQWRSQRSSERVGARH